jgi:pimeloyl-ACP methyl ester carboxylesterase
MECLTEMTTSLLLLRRHRQHEEPNFFSDFLESYRHAFMNVRHLHPSMEDLRNMMTNVTSVQELRNMVHHAANEMGGLVHHAVAPARNIVNHAAHEMGDLMNSVTPVQEIRNMVSHAANEISSREFHPVQEIRNFMVGTAGATASHMYETLIPSGSMMDKRLTAVSHATYTQLIDAWNSVKNIRERLEMAHSVSKQRKHLRQQLKGYRVMLNQMREMSYAVPSKQMAQMMNRITDCNERMELLESKARAAFVSATGFTLKKLPGFGARQEPQRYAKYSSDPLLGLATYPLGVHLTILGCTEIPLRIILKKRGFERTSIGPITYYYHPGIDTMTKNKHQDNDGETTSDLDDDLISTGSSSKGSSLDHDFDDDRPLPLIFIHGIGLGLLPYMPLIDALLKLGRPLFLPEIPYVSGFRPWQSPNCVLQPAVVTSTMTAMLATHGYLRASWLGHSYGTTWLSYMCQLAESTVASIIFLDPVCFGLHIPCLAKQFVYSRPDPGKISYIVRTDVIVKWTIQRSFPWASVELFLEQIGDRPCHIFLSENDILVPAKRVQEYLKDNYVDVINYCTKQNKVIVQDSEDDSCQVVEHESDVKKTKKSNRAIAPQLSDIACTDEHDIDDVVADDDVTVRHNNDSNHNPTKNETNSNHNGIVSSTTITKHKNVRCTVFLGDGHGDWTERSSSFFDSIGRVAYDLCLQVEENDRQIRQATTTTALTSNLGTTLVTNIPSELRN